MPCYSPLKGWRDRETGGLRFRPGGEAQESTLEVACGQCIGCRLDRAHMWAVRLSHEAGLHELDQGNSFVTLTYRSKETCTQKQLEKRQHVPDDWSLRKEHFQKFMKRLRKARPGVKMKYFHAGEYGNRCRHGLDLEKVGCPLCNLGRPHYHAILLNCSFPDRDGNRSQELEDLWSYGFTDVGDVSMQSAGYVARYCLKKVTGVNSEDHYVNVSDDGEVIQVEPEYATMSNGIAREWFEKWKGDVFPSDQVPLPGGGVVNKAPRYFDEMLKREDPDTYEEVKERRQAFRQENAAEYSSDRLMSKYKVKRAQIGRLVRDLE